jgi:hypothetical protein
MGLHQIKKLCTSKETIIRENLRIILIEMIISQSRCISKHQVVPLGIYTIKKECMSSAEGKQK